RERCEAAIQQQLLDGYSVHNAKGFPVFAFRLHQFLSRGDTVYASPEPPKSRYLTLARQRFVPESDRERVLLPLSFCRECGQDYYVVARHATDTGTVVVPRDLGDTAGENNLRPGFLFINTDWPWPDDEVTARDRLPEDWFDSEGKLRSNHRDHLPTRVAVKSDGSLGDDGADTTAAWWVPVPFRFCLSCGVSYGSRLGRDFTRLTTLGSDGRSTATTIMSLAAVRYLREDATLPTEARKLLSFTDNRQDASLQAGHFNDFIQVTVLRAALWRAVHAAGEHGLAYDQLPQQVFDALNLPFDQYAKDPDLKGMAKSDTDRVLRELLAYRLYRDLMRGWRLTQPNLEQCGLLRIDYSSLDELARDESEWATCHPALAEVTPQTREFVLRVLLDSLRRDLAIKVDVLTRDYQERIEARADQRLAGSWGLEDERLEYAPTAVPRGRGRLEVRDIVFVSARGGFGQFLRRPNALGDRRKLSLDDTGQIIEQLFDRLRVYGLLEIVGEDADGSPRYQLPASAVRWLAGDGSAPYHDHIRMPTQPPSRSTNDFFVDLYRHVGQELLGIEAREHTAQVPYDERMKREDRFRSAELPVLYCSPTMELGVDIAQLNVVNMRNVPPTPANYAQRSGRAGRSGQPALVFTYCTAGSSHDQHYFKYPEQMVAGQVQAPRLELANEDLVRRSSRATGRDRSTDSQGNNTGVTVRSMRCAADGVAAPGSGDATVPIATGVEKVDSSARSAE
ncbi:MAG: helicase-related protein, partial [Acidimicrobiales bacterium]